jgi:murein DD-endopeptidase MepM/ murein hydrolase activator NlpD
VLSWLVQQVNSLWSYIRSRITAVYTAISATATSLWNGLDRLESDLRKAISGTAYGLQAWVRGEIDAAWKGILSAASALVRAASDFIEAELSNLEKWVRGNIASILAWVEERIAAGQALVEGLVKALTGTLLTLVSPVVTFYQAVKDTIIGLIKFWTDHILPALEPFRQFLGLLRAGNLGKIVSLIGPLFDWLVQLFTDPLGWLAAWFDWFLLDWLADRLAEALGSVKYDLGPRAKFSLAGGAWTVGGGTGPPPGASGLASPLDSLYISGYTFGPGHRGIDLGLQMGDPVYAMHDGQVILVRREETLYGHQIVLEGGGWWSRYAHLAAIGVDEGDTVRQRQQIATGDSTGNSTGPHLHLEIKWQGQFIDPMRVLPIG